MKHSSALLLLLVLSGAGCEPAVSGSRSQPARESTGGDARDAVAPAAESRQVEPESRTPPRSFSSIDEAIGVLCEAAETRDSQARLQASDWLARQGAAALPRLQVVLEDDQADTAARIAVCRVLGRLGPPALEVLCGQLDSDDQMVRLNALSQLPHLQPVTPDVVSALIGVLDHEDMRMRARAVQGLGSLGQRAEAAAPRLQQILNSKQDDQLRREAKKALQQVDPRRTLTFD